MNRRTPPKLRINQKTCNGCMSCQSYCATAREGVGAASCARVHVILDPWNARHRLEICRQCRDAACAAACPEDAIQLSEDGSYWFIDYDRCTTCQKCVEACKLDGIWYDPVTQRVLKCDTCHGDPMCVRICPTGALSLREDE